MKMFYVTYQIKIKGDYTPHVDFFFAKDWEDAGRILSKDNDADNFEELGIVYMDGSTISLDYINADFLKNFKDDIIKSHYPEYIKDIHNNLNDWKQVFNNI